MNSQQVAMIVAHDRNGAIGYAGQLPWHLPADLQRFKALTMGHTIVMGRKTYESIGRPLPGRNNWVLTRDANWQAPGVHVFQSWQAARDQHQTGQLWVIGGGEIYRAAIADVQRMETTEVNVSLSHADAWFTRPDDSNWVVVERQFHPVDARHAFEFEFVTRVLVPK